MGWHSKLVMILSLALVGCDQVQNVAPNSNIVANDSGVARPAGWGPKSDLIDSTGRVVGEVRTRKGAGVWGLAVGIDYVIEGAAPGAHGMHVHSIGRCDTPDFVSAGEHWNPTKRQHGQDNPKGQHLGDLLNFEILPEGGGEMSTTIAAARLDSTDPGSRPVVRDADGATVIVHSSADDYRTDPSGNSGSRVACAVIPPAE